MCANETIEETKTVPKNITSTNFYISLTFY